MKRPRTGFTRTERVFVKTSGLFVVVLLALGAWWQEHNRDPVVQIPPVVLPKPNAFADYREAASMVIGGRQLSDALLTEVERKYNFRGGISPRAYSLTDKENLLSANMGVLPLLREGLKKPYYEPPVRSTLALPRYYHEFRRLGRLLRLEAQIKAAHGDAVGSVHSCLDALQYGRSLTRGANLAGFTTGIRVQTYAQHEMWRTLRGHSVHNHSFPVGVRLSLPQLRHAVACLETIASSRSSLTDALQEEKRLTQSTLMELFSKPGWRAAFIEWTNTSSPATEWWARARLIYTSKRSIMDAYTASIDKHIAAASQPYSLMKPVDEEPPDPILARLQPITSDDQFLSTHNEAQNALLLTSLALHAYKIAHKTYPTTLQVLAPAYLKSVPRDPFTPLHTLGYRQQGATYVLYSIGPDGQDDKGKPISDMEIPYPVISEATSHLYHVHSNSKGDIVAGINTRTQQ